MNLSAAPLPGISIHPGEPRDLPEVMATMATAFDAAFGEAWTPPQCLGVLSIPDVWLMLARRDGQPAGFALTRVVLDEAELLLLAVQPAHRRAGIGRALLTAVGTGARDRGASKLHLEVRDGNGALQLYRAAGLVPVGRRRDYYRGADGRTFDAITLSTSLADIRA